MPRNNLIKSPLSLPKKAILTVFGILLSLVILELGLRLGGFIFLSLQEYRNRAAIYKKGAYRIMCLGESTTAVGGNDSYPSQLEEVLNQRNIGITFSVINKGTPNINTSYILAHLEENLNRYHPDMVTAMMGTNDIYIKYYEEIPDANIFLFNKFRAYRFLRILWMNMAKKIRKIGIYKPEEKAKATTLRSNLSTVALKKSEGELKKDIVQGCPLGECPHNVPITYTIKNAEGAHSCFSISRCPRIYCSRATLSFLKMNSFRII